MVGQFQGFDKNLNLVETKDDRDILNNLGGTPIADDIGLFVNNLRNFSVLVVTESMIQGESIIFPISTPFVYTTGTKISVNNNFYTVYDSRKNLDGLLSFKLRDADDNDVLAPPTGEYRRNDAITKDDVRNILKERRLVVTNPNASRSFAINSFIGVNPYTSILTAGKLIDNQLPDNLSELIEGIDENINSFNLIRETSLIRTQNFSTNRVVTFNGSTVIFDPDNIVQATEPLTDDKPGIYILNPLDNTFKRIFSSNENVWSDNGIDLVADSKEIIVKKLIFENDIKLVTSNLGAFAEPVAANEADIDFTHFTKVLINGEEYFLCLKAD